MAAAAGRGVPVLGEVELFARMARAPVVAVTGTNGKSTVCAWVHAMAEAAGRRAALGGNFGPPALTLLDRDPDLYIVELSSFQLETTRTLRPRVAALLNVSPDHLDRHRGFEDYRAAKARIFRGARTAVVWRDDAWLAALGARLAREGSRVISYTAERPPRGRVRHRRARYASLARARDGTAAGGRRAGAPRAPQRAQCPRRDGDCGGTRDRGRGDRRRAADVPRARAPMRGDRLRRRRALVRRLEGGRTSARPSRR